MLWSFGQCGRCAPNIFVFPETSPACRGRQKDLWSLGPSCREGLGMLPLCTPCFGHKEELMIMLTIWLPALSPSGSRRNCWSCWPSRNPRATGKSSVDRICLESVFGGPRTQVFASPALVPTSVAHSSWVFTNGLARKPQEGGAFCWRPGFLPQK